MQNKTEDDRTVEAYFADVRQTSLLTAEEERALFRQYRTCTRCKWTFPHDGKARGTCAQCGAKRNFRPRDKLIDGALRFVIKVAKDYARRARGSSQSTDTLKMLISAGNLGLLVAVDRFDLSRGTRFLTYAAWWIKEKIREDLDNSGLVHVPAYRQKDLRLRRRQGEDVEFDTAFVVLESAEVIDDNSCDDQIEVNLINKYGAALIHDALARLDFVTRDRYILLAYFGVREEAKNLRQISSRLDLSSERVRQIKQDALVKLRDYLEDQHIEDSEHVFTE